MVLNYGLVIKSMMSMGNSCGMIKRGYPLFGITMKSIYHDFMKLTGNNHQRYLQEKIVWGWIKRVLRD